MAPGLTVGPFVTISVHNAGLDVISVSVSGVVSGTQVNFGSGNYGNGGTKVFQLPAIVQNLTVTIRREAFIEKWDTVVSNTWANTLSDPTTGAWSGQNCSYNVDDGNPGGPNFSG